VDPIKRAYKELNYEVIATLCLSLLALPLFARTLASNDSDVNQLIASKKCGTSANAA